jgi:CubicO group peptidase (beta-lactamase class C family)
MGGVAGHAGLFATAREVSRIAAALVGAWRGAADPIVATGTVRRFWSPSGTPGSTWCLGWDRPSPGASQAGARWPRDGVGHLGFTGSSLWIDPPRARWVVLLSNRVLFGRDHEAIRAFRPALHDAIVAALEGD